MNEPPLSRHADYLFKSHPLSWRLGALIVTGTGKRATGAPIRQRTEGSDAASVPPFTQSDDIADNADGTTTGTAHQFRFQFRFQFHLCAGRNKEWNYAGSVVRSVIYQWVTTEPELKWGRNRWFSRGGSMQVIETQVFSETEPELSRKQ